MTGTSPSFPARPARAWPSHRAADVQIALRVPNPIFACRSPQPVRTESVHCPPFRATMEVMIHTTATFEEIARFLYRDPFANASILAAVERRHARLRDVWTYQERDVKGVLVFSPGPAGERGVGLEAETPEGAAALLESLPAGEEFGFGLHRSWMVPIVEDL